MKGIYIGSYISMLTINFLLAFFAMLAGRNPTDGKKSYTIFQHPDSRISAVKNGFNWTAFFFSFFWVLIKKIWVHAAIVWLIGTIIGVLAIPVPAILFGLIYGFKGNELVRKNLLDRGYKNKKDISARNPDDALGIFYDGKH